MTTEMTVSPSHSQVAKFGEMEVLDVVARKRKLQEIMKAVMIEDEHYGLIPGCGNKPALFKAGAEVLAVTFGLAPRFAVKRTDMPHGHREYEVTCTLKHIASGLDVGEGLGAATTMESKHRWRAAARKCTDCGQPAIIKGKAEYGGGWVCFTTKGGCGKKWKNGDQAIEGQETGRIENPDPADLYNTILKMAKKRAQVDAILTAVGASDILTQDLEDLEDTEEAIQSRDSDHHDQRPQPSPPKPWIVDLAACTSVEACKVVESKIRSMAKGALRTEAEEALRQRIAQIEAGVPPEDVQDYGGGYANSQPSRDRAKDRVRERARQNDDQGDQFAFDPEAVNQGRRDSGS